MDGLKYAVVFKTHFWDDFVERQLTQLISCAGTKNIFVLVDETHGAVNNIPYENVIRMTEATSVAEGYLHFPKGNLFWYNTDYQLYHFADLYPDFDYFVTSEFDCFVHLDISQLVETMKSQSLDFVGQPISTPLANWDWVHTARPYYDETIEINGRLLCFAVFSNSFVRKLQSARRDKTLMAMEGEVFRRTGSNFTWPNNEAFVACEIARLGIKAAHLSEFVDTTYYEWSPPYYEALIDRLKSDSCIIHPVLTGQRYLRSISKLRWIIEDLFVPGTYLHNLMETRPTTEVLTVFWPHFAAKRDMSSLRKLRDYAERRGDFDVALFNMAKGKPATQSSTCEFSHSLISSEDAAGAVSGNFDRDYGFHTDYEASPWWCVDLEFPMPIREIRIFNRLGFVDRARSLSAHVSVDMINWREVYLHDGREAFGGSDGNPLIVHLGETESLTEIRFIRLQLNHSEVFHLQQVEAYL